MWVLVFFDLPTETKKDKKNYTNFRKALLKDGFTMFQFSIYLRFCSSRENTRTHVNRIKKSIPPGGSVGILTVTDKQFGLMEIFEAAQKMKSKGEPKQLEMF